MPTSTIDYHLQELAVARDTANPRRSMPPITSADRTILDLGCGAGQTLIAADLGPDHTLVGLDIDGEAIALGRTLCDAIHFLHADAGSIPLASSQVDLIISRVSLPYTDVPSVVREMARVLRPGGRCWVVLHPLSFAARALGAALVERRPKQALYQLYVLANGLLLHVAGRVVSHPLRRARRESVQTTSGIRRVFRSAGFTDIRIERDPAFVLTARR
jgi:ubiquinone/menaquinone biosynthesis C-methylase UbiE